MKLKVYRYQEGMEYPEYDSFEVEREPGLTVLGALLQIQEQLDDSLSFRYSCRGAVCGTCAMLINKVPALACRTQIEPLLKGDLQVSLFPYPGAEETVPWDAKKEVLIEPLPHMAVIKDLMVDMDKFFEYYHFIQPVFKPSDINPEKERLMDPQDVKKLEEYTSCILCAACFGACPVEGENPEYLGPAALAKLYRFHIDPREEDTSRLKIADIPPGWWACDSIGNCLRVCPKKVPPIKAIILAREELNEKK